LNCNRCGCETTSAYIAKRVERGLEPVCQDCAARRRKTIRTAYGICYPHHGLFDDQDNPLDKQGNPYLAGERLCGKRDCINRDHIRIIK
jgi:hypothetical protein